jgi:hypothetical protein
MILSHTPTVDAIQASAGRHAELVREINELDYAKPALDQCSAYLRDLKGQKDVSTAALARLAKSTAKERTEHIELKKSITRKWSSKLVGRGEKFQKRVTKEEKSVHCMLVLHSNLTWNSFREYLEALENEHEARVKHEKLLADIDEAESNVCLPTCLPYFLDDSQTNRIVIWSRLARDETICKLSSIYCTSACSQVPTQTSPKRMSTKTAYLRRKQPTTKPSRTSRMNRRLFQF